VGCKYCRCPNFVEPDGSYIVETPLRDALARAQREASEYDDVGDSPLVVILGELQERREAASAAATPESCPHHGVGTPQNCTCKPDCYCVTRTCEEVPRFTRQQWDGRPVD
jgi:hypothetical protein